MTDYSSLALSEAVQALQLPVDDSLSSEVLAAVQNLLKRNSLETGDGALVILEAIEDWRANDVPNDFLKGLIPTILTAGIPGDRSAVMAGGYLAWFAKLRAGSDDWNGVTQTTARRLLSRLALINHLLTAEMMSCTQISRLLHSLESSLDVPYQAIQVIARGLNSLPSLTLSVAGDQLWRSDELRGLIMFPDTTLVESCEVAATDIERYLPELNVLSLLQDLSRAYSESEIRWPYVQILHFCCTSIEFYDHPASYLYEFAPRGQIALALFARYPAVTGNPVLNNAKAVQTLDRAWARNRGGDDAHSLVAILEALESLPHSTRREVARVLRSWIQRVIELETVTPVPLPNDLHDANFEQAILHVATGETNTQGVIEQRIVDYLASITFESAGWRARGIGDSVNASNHSRHKLGDIEFTNVNLRTATAVEAHGGHLSATYVRDHQRSLARIVDQRLLESWQALDDPSAWSIKVIFIAHSRDVTLPESEVLHEVRVTYEYWDYGQLINAAESADKWRSPRDLFNQLVIEPLNASTTRQSVRDRFLEISGRAA